MDQAEPAQAAQADQSATPKLRLGPRTGRQRLMLALIFVVIGIYLAAAVSAWLLH